MSEDTRNSLIAWGSILAMFGLFWFGSHDRQMLPDLPNWVPPVFLALGLIQMAWRFVRGLRTWVRAKPVG